MTMLILAIILGLLALTSGVLWYYEGVIRTKREGVYGMRTLGWVMVWCFGGLGLLCLIAFLSSLKLNFDNQNLTGYIYASNSRFGYTAAHIRYSQKAGTDAQPSFCVKTDSTAGRDIKKYTGSEQKVDVVIPPYFYFANNPFACGTTKMTIKVSSN